MNTVSIWRFDTSAGAEVALDALEQLQARRLVAVDDVAVVAWRPGARRPLAYQVGTEAGNTLSGAFWGLLFGLLFLLPLAGAGNGAEDGAENAVLARIGLTDGFLARVRERITPGTSALFLLTGAAAVDRVRGALADTHTDLLVSTLDREHVAALRRAFDADADADTDTDTDDHAHQRTGTQEKRS